MREKSSESSPTPDLLPRFQRGSRLDKAEHGMRGRDNADVISGAAVLARSPAGPKCHLDGPASGLGVVRSESLGAGSESLADAARSISSGAKAPKVNWSKLK